MHYNEAPPRGRGQESAAACLLRSGRVSRAFLRVLHTLQILACLARALRCGSLRVSLVLVSLTLSRLPHALSVSTLTLCRQSARRHSAPRRGEHNDSVQRRLLCRQSVHEENPPDLR